jgi:hypothetical protein
MKIKGYGVLALAHLNSTSQKITQPESSEEMSFKILKISEHITGSNMVGLAVPQRRTMGSRRQKTPKLLRFFSDFVPLCYRIFLIG